MLVLMFGHRFFVGGYSPAVGVLCFWLVLGLGVVFAGE